MEHAFKNVGAAVSMAALTTFVAGEELSGMIS